MMEYILMKEEHIASIAALEKMCFSDPWSVQSVATELSNPLSLWLVAEDDGRVAGYVGSQSVMGWADMMNLAVDPYYRRKGVAERLVNELIRYLRENAVSCLTLEVRASNIPAISLYEKMGFQMVGKRPGYYHHPKEDALIMRKEWPV